MLRLVNNPEKAFLLSCGRNERFLWYTLSYYLCQDEPSQTESSFFQIPVSVHVRDFGAISILRDPMGHVGSFKTLARK